MRAFNGRLAERDARSSRINARLIAVIKISLSTIIFFLFDRLGLRKNLATSFSNKTINNTVKSNKEILRKWLI